MLKTVVVTGTMALALLASAAVFPTISWAQGAAPCSGPPGTDVNGVIQSQGVAPAGGWDGTCEAVVHNDGRVSFQNGPAATDPQGPDALHEGNGGAH